MVHHELALFVGTFTTLLAIINPLEVLPVYLKLLAGADLPTRRAVAVKSCVYAASLCFFFLIFGTLLMRIFGVPLSMVRIVGGIILMKIDFELFASSPPGKNDMLSGNAASGDIAFVPLAIDFGFRGVERTLREILHVRPEGWSVNLTDLRLGMLELGKWETFAVAHHAWTNQCR